VANFTQKTVHTHPRPLPHEVLAKAKKPVVLVLEDIRSGNNVGSILRTADAFGLEEVIMVGYTPTPPHREILKTSLGAEEAVAWRKGDTIQNVVNVFRDRGYRIAALEQATDSIGLDEYEVSEVPGTVIILGNEVRGVSQEALDVCDVVLEIAQHGTKQSLNVSVAAGIVAYCLANSY